jgi:hypothetical protein
MMIKVDALRQRDKGEEHDEEAKRALHGNLLAF